MEDWAAHVERERARHEDGVARLSNDDTDARQKQLTRVANAALGAGFASLMAGSSAAARPWFLEAAGRYRESYDGAPPASWGRLIGMLKMRVAASDWDGARSDASWSLEQGPADAESPIGWYTAALAHLVLGQDDDALVLAGALRRAELFPSDVADALCGLAAGDSAAYADGLQRIVRSFEDRDEYLEDVPIADTALVLDALAERRGCAQRPSSPLLPASGVREGP